MSTRFRVLAASVAGLRLAWRDVYAVLDLHAGLSLPRLIPQLVGGLLVGVLLYVPIHELLHAAGCVLVGGEVTEIEISPTYGGRFLARLIPVVSTETEYAGRLSGFDVGGSSLRLLAIDFAPYLLTVFPGVPLLRRLQRRRRAWLVAPALLLALAPWLSLPGDYYEMGSTVVTGVLGLAGQDWSALRSDDLLLLCTALWKNPADFGAAGLVRGWAAGCIVAMSFLTGFLLAGATYVAGSRLALPPQSPRLEAGE